MAHAANVEQTPICPLARAAGHAAPADPARIGGGYLRRYGVGRCGAVLHEQRALPLYAALPHDPRILRVERAHVCHA